MIMTGTVAPVGDLLREWRQRRRLSQLQVALEMDVSTRHLSFVETGRSVPSREMILRLAEQLEVPVRERNVLLVAAGYAPIFPAHRLEDPALDQARKAIDLVLERQRPYPAFALDRHWQILASNAALPELYVGAADFLLAPPINAMRLSLHPQGVAPRIVNFIEWRAHLLDRLRRQIDLTADPVLADLMRELSAYPLPNTTADAVAAHGARAGQTITTRSAATRSAATRAAATTSTSASSRRSSRTTSHPINTDAVLVPLRIMTDAGLLSFFSTTTVFGTPLDITLSELALELFYPADAETDAIVQRLTRAH